MRQYKFHVYFTGTTPVEVTAGTFNSALILATAERLKAGLSTFVSKVENMDLGERIMVKTENPITINWHGSIIKF